MKLLFFIAQLGLNFFVYGQQMDNPYKLRNGLEVKNENTFHVAYTPHSGVFKPNYQSIPFNMQRDYAVSLRLPNLRPKKINLSGLPQGLFHLAADILSGFAP